MTNLARSHSLVPPASAVAVLFAACVNLTPRWSGPQDGGKGDRHADSASASGGGGGTSAIGPDAGSGGSGGSTASGGTITGGTAADGTSQVTTGGTAGTGTGGAGELSGRMRLRWVGRLGLEPVVNRPGFSGDLVT